MNTVVKGNAGLLDEVAREIGIASAVVTRSIYRAINAVAAKTLTRSRRLIVDQVNLGHAYVRERMSLRRANPGQLSATISARTRSTRLATYGARQVTKKAPKPVKGSRRFGVQSGSGDSMRGIPKGSVPHGIRVGVKRGGARKRMPGAFFMPLLAGKVAAGNGMGVFIRTGSGKKDIKHLYGPSVDQLFNGVIRDIEDDVQDELNAAVLRQARYEFGKALKAS